MTIAALTAHGLAKSFNLTQLFQDVTFSINPGDRVLVPTGLIMKIVDSSGSMKGFANYSIRLHARSGNALRRGLVLANAEGIIDADYQHEVFMLMTNISSVAIDIKRGERLCQGEIVKNLIANWSLVSEMPKSFSDRDGGFGSTGI